jgi:hypothetical protein
LLYHAHFSGDPNPSDRLKQSYDPLFTAGGDRGFGSWVLGEISGQYIGPNSNLNVAMAHLKFAPLDTVEAGIIYYDFHFDQTAQCDNPSITSKHAAQAAQAFVWIMGRSIVATGAQ